MRKIIYILGFLCPVLFAEAQFCTGNVGEDIFLDGDFGSGVSNILSVDPGIAPGFVYNPITPLYDGEYIITNNIGLWQNSWDWLPIQETSSDPDGYMMVVNASFEPGLFYSQLIDGLCPNTLYEFTAEIINVIPPGSNALKPNVSFLLDGVEVINTGSIPEDAQWHTYGFTFTTEPDQTSLTLSLSNNAPGGIGNDLAIDNISFRACGPEAFILPEEVEYLCLDGSALDLEVTIIGDQYSNPTFQWQQSYDEGLTWEDIVGSTDLSYTHNDFSSGYYYYRFLVSNNEDNLSNDKCRVNSNSKLIQILPEEYVLTDSICEGVSFLVGDTFYTEAGTYIDTLVSFHGCDSILTLNLSVVEDPGIILETSKQDPSCSYSFDGSIQLDAVLNASEPYTVFVNSELLEEPWQINLLQEGNFTFELLDNNGCFASDQVELNRPDSFYVDLGLDFEVLLGEEVDVLTSSNYDLSNYTWTPESLINCQVDCDNEQVLFIYDTQLILEATNAFGCIALDSVFVSVDTSRKVFFPNIISANNDGINDSFTVYGSEPQIQIVRSMQIFDRWGALVFNESNFPVNDETAGWNPSRSSNDYEVGVFVFVAELEFLDGAIRQYSGTFTLNK